MASLILMSDPRLSNLESAARVLPRNSALIYRHFGASNKAEIAHRLRQICFERGSQFLIGNDPQLAIACGADGVHFAQRSMEQAQVWRQRCPDFIISCAVHDTQSISRANALPLDAVTLSPVFESQSPSAASPLGPKRAAALIAQSIHPVIALGGINSETAHRLLGSRAVGIAGVSGIMRKI
jgi:thiamine-phosphate pyrophosphorylase